MNRSKKILFLALAGIMLAGGLSACSSIAPPDKVGLYYEQGPIEGDHFGHCFNPGTTSSYPINDYTVLLPTSLRTWKISENSTDSNQPIQVPSAPQADQPGGVMMNIWTQTNFMLNTNCDGGENSPIVQFWEKIGRRYGADQDEGWKTMLENTIVTALTTVTANTVREYQADVLVSGVKKDEIQQKISDAFTPELKRLVGGDFFCGPTFSRESSACPKVEVLLLPVDYANPDIQAARDEKQAAVERAAAVLAEAQGAAAAAVAEAQGKVDAAELLNSLYNNPAWVALQEAQLQYESIAACAQNPNCTIIMGDTGEVLVSR